MPTSSSITSTLQYTNSLFYRTHSALRTWLRSNTHILSATADTLHSIALLSPSAHAEFRAELAATLVSLLSLYRDYPPLNLSRRRCISLLALNVLCSVQLLLEMATVRNSKAPNSQLTVASAIEAAKAALRLQLLFDRPDKTRLLAHADQALPEAPPPPICTCGMRDIHGGKDVVMEKGTRTSRAIIKPRHMSKRHRPLSEATIAGLEPPPPHLRRLQPNSDPMLEALCTIAYERRANWVVRMFMGDTECPACSPPPPAPPNLQETLQGIHTSLVALTPFELGAEIIYIIRPFVHLMLIRRFGWRSWRAWSTALVLDLGSRAAMASPSNDADVAERKRRMAQLVLYLGRSPLFDLILRRFLKRFTSPLRRIPVVGGVASSAIEWITLLQQYWFYTSAS